MECTNKMNSPKKKKTLKLNNENYQVILHVKVLQWFINILSLSLIKCHLFSLPTIRKSLLLLIQHFSFAWSIGANGCSPLSGFKCEIEKDRYLSFLDSNVYWVNQGSTIAVRCICMYAYFYWRTHDKFYIV